MAEEMNLICNEETLAQPYQDSLFSEVIHTVANCVQTSIGSNAAASKAYTLEVQKRIADIDEAVASGALSVEEADRQRKIKDAYIADLKEESERTRKSSIKIVKYVSGFGGAALIVVLGCRLFRPAA